MRVVCAGDGGWGRSSTFFSYSHLPPFPGRARVAQFHATHTSDPGAAVGHAVGAEAVGRGLCWRDALRGAVPAGRVANL